MCSNISTCNYDRVRSWWSELQGHLVLVFVYSQMVLIGEPLERKNSDKNIS